MAFNHTRSQSFPSTSNPAKIQVEENLSLQASSLSLSSFTYRLNGLKNVYENVDNLLLMPHFQRIISQERHEKWVNEILDGYITVLDACATAKDLFSCAKSDVLELLSTLRRRNNPEDVHAYLTSRKKFRKIVQKSLKLTSTNNKQNETRPVVQMFLEAESATLAMIESMLLYMIGTKVQARPSSWSLVSNLMHLNKESKECEQTELNEFNKVETALLAFIDSEANEEDDVKVVELLNHLKNMESDNQILEEGLECLFRRLIRTRVLLLNILSQ